MARLALISDIHGNLVALDAVLADVARRGIDRLVCLGDVAASGPWPRGALERVRDLGCPVVMGNADAWLLDPVPPDDPTPFLEQVDAVDRWALAQLEPAHLEFVRSFRPRVELELGEVRIVAVHGSPRSFHEPIEPTTPAEGLDAALADLDTDLLVAGHTHQPMLRRHRTTTLLNPGSVGLPYERLPGGGARNAPWAEYAVLAHETGRLEATFHRLPLDPERIRAAMRGSGMPHAEAWAAHWG